MVSQAILLIVAHPDSIFDCESRMHSVLLLYSLAVLLLDILPGSLFASVLAHLSRRLIGELIVYTGIRRPSVRPSSVHQHFQTFSSETVRPILSTLHI